MRKITNLEQLAQTARAAKTFTSGLVGELAEAADKDIAAAKSAADAAKSAAQTAQSTADTAKTAAQTAQNTANAAKAAAVVMKGASASAAGTAGLAPAPAAGAQGKYLRGDGTWQTPPDTNTTYNAATQSANGLMSAADKKKLDGIATGANAYSHPATSGNKHIPSGGSSGQILRWSADGTAAWGADNNTTYSAATQSANGLMSAADKKKLDNIATSNIYTSEYMANDTIINDTNKAFGPGAMAVGSAAIAGGHYDFAQGNHVISSVVVIRLTGAGKTTNTYNMFSGPSGYKPSGKIRKGDEVSVIIIKHDYSATALKPTIVDTSVTAITDSSITFNTNINSGYSDFVVVCRKPIYGTFANHVEGEFNIVSAMASHAEGSNNLSYGDQSHVEGYYCVTAGRGAHAEGDGTLATGNYSHAEGSGTIADREYLHVSGLYNKASADTNDLFIIGKGTSSARANCFRITKSGTYGVSAFNSTGADYAELMEWQDGNPDAEDRCGKFVTIVGDKIKIASPADTLIMGIISGSPSVVGDVHDDQWIGMYLTDVFGRPLWEDVEVPDETMEEPDPEDPEKTITRVIIPAHTEHRQKLNPNFDNSQPYEPRTKRKEWDAVGMLGKLVAVDDGTCTAGGYCTVGEGGIATASAAQTKYYVMKRIDETHIHVLIL